MNDILLINLHQRRPAEPQDRLANCPKPGSSAVYLIQKHTNGPKPQQTGMQLYDPEGRRLYFTESERRAFLQAVARASREVRSFAACCRPLAAGSPKPWR